MTRDRLDSLPDELDSLPDELDSFSDELDSLPDGLDFIRSNPISIHGIPDPIQDDPDVLVFVAQVVQNGIYFQIWKHQARVLEQNMLAARAANRDAQALAAYTDEAEAKANHAVAAHLNATSRDIEHMAERTPQIARRYVKVLTVVAPRRDRRGERASEGEQGRVEEGLRGAPLLPWPCSVWHLGARGWIDGLRGIENRKAMPGSAVGRRSFTCSSSTRARWICRCHSGSSATW